MLIVSIYLIISRVMNIILYDYHSIKTNNNREKLILAIRSYIPCHNYEIETGRSYENVKVYIQRCIFQDLLNFLVLVELYLLNHIIILCSFANQFFSCYCSSSGGAILFDSKDTTISKVSASYNQASKCHFAHFSSANQNYAEYISILFCSSFTNGDYSCRQINGDIKLLSMNSSMNKAYHVRGLELSYLILFQTIIHPIFMGYKYFFMSIQDYLLPILLIIRSQMLGLLALQVVLHQWNIIFLVSIKALYSIAILGV